MGNNSKYENDLKVNFIANHTLYGILNQPLLEHMHTDQSITKVICLI